jgi:hypothetical protein
MKLTKCDICGEEIKSGPVVVGMDGIYATTLIINEDNPSNVLYHKSLHREYDLCAIHAHKVIDFLEQLKAESKADEENR